MTKEELQQRRELWCRLFGLPLEFLEDIENCVIRGKSNLNNDHTPKGFFFGKKKIKPKKKKRR